LKEPEVEGYIRHRRAVAGSNGGLVFAEDALKTIYRHSGGIPRLINILADKALLRGFVLETFTINGDLVQHCIEELEGETIGLV
jgi:general secretion pathway protein A